jgi:hypothetical protein
VTTHPNATAAALAGAVVTIAVYVAGLAGLSDIPDEVVAALTTIVLALVLYIGRRSR